jgi:acetyl esterase/lipase
MEVIATLGDGIAEVVGPTYGAYQALLQKPEAKVAIKSVKKETFSYGSHERQKLDIYTTPTVSSSLTQRARPVLVFAYGGAFASGGRILDGIVDELVYANVAAFFASQAHFETIVLDYRLISHGARYPSGGDDFGQGLKWIQNRSQYAEKREIYVLANSAGAAHFATWLFAPKFAKERADLLGDASRPRLTKAVLLGCPYRLDYHGGMAPMLEAYYGDEAETKKGEPTALMLAALEGPDAVDIASMPTILTAVSELDPSFIVEPAREFSKLWEEHGGKGEYFVLKGHNHISPVLSLSTGIVSEEQWGYQVARWLQDEGL